MPEVRYTPCYAQHVNACATDPCVTQKTAFFQLLAPLFIPVTHPRGKYYMEREEMADFRHSTAFIESAVGSLGGGSVTPSTGPAA